MWRRSLHSESHPGLPSTPLDAHRCGSMSAAIFTRNYNTRVKFWPIMSQNLIPPDKIHDTHDHARYLLVFLLHASYP